MANRVVWTPSTDANIDHYLLQSSPDALTWTQIANITHNLSNSAVYDSAAGVFYFTDTSGTTSTWYRVMAVDSLGQSSSWSSAFQAGSVAPLGFYGYGGSMALSQLMIAARRESDTENDPHISDDELVGYINQSRLELYDLLITAYGDDYYSAQATIPLVANQALYPLPDGTLYSGAAPYYKGLLVEAVAGPNVLPNQPITLHRFNLAEKNRYNLPQMLAITPFMLPRYRLNGSSILFAPTPVSAGITVQVWYAPKLKPLVASTDVAEDFSGWLEYVVVDAAIKIKDKQERDVSVLGARKVALLARIRAASVNRDVGEPATVVETGQEGFSSGFPFGMGTNFF